MKTKIILTLLALSTALYALPPLAGGRVSRAEAKDAALPSPLTLDDALDYAMKHSPALVLVKEQLKEQQGILVQSAAKGLPSVVAEGSAAEFQHTAQPTAGGANSGGRRTWSADVTLTQSLFAGGGILSGVRSSFASAQAAKARVTSAIESTVLAVKEGFYQVLVNREIIAVHEESLKVLEEQLKNVEAKHQAGVASDFELLQAQVAVANERPLLIRARNDYRVAAEALQAVLGTPAALELNPDDVQGELAIEELNVSLTDLLASAELHRADIRAANRDFAAAQSAVWVSRADYLPKVNAFGGYAWQKSVMTTNLDSSIDGWKVGLVANWTLFDSFGREARIYSAVARRRQAAARDLQTRLNVAVEVRQTNSDFEQSKEILVSARQVVDQARESLRMAKARYSAGSSTQLDVLQAQSALSRARLTYLQAQFDTIVAIARLEKATGSHDWKITVEENAAAPAAVPAVTPAAAPVAEGKGK